MTSLRRTLLNDLADAVAAGDTARASEIRARLNALYSVKARETREATP
jgi:hypothetical protein